MILALDWSSAVGLIRSFKEQGRGSLQSMIFGIFSPINSFALDYVTRREEEEWLKMEQLSTSDNMLKNISLFNFQKYIGPTIKRALILFNIISIFLLLLLEIIRESMESIASGYFSNP